MHLIFTSFRHNFNDTLNPMCPINDGVEDTEHFLLHCHSYYLQRNSLLSHVQATLLSCGLSNLSNEDLVSIILYGDERLPLKSNKAIIKATLEFIESSKRFSLVISMRFPLFLPTFVSFLYHFISFRSL